MTININLSDRYIRQRDIIPVETLRNADATIVGVGAVGRQVALQMAAMGIGHITLVDFDMVSVENLASQGFMEDDIGRPKVTAVADLCRRINSEISVTPVCDRFKRSMATSKLFMCCVDSITTRSFIWNNLVSKVEFFCDTRMSAEVARVIVVDSDKTCARYSSTLFDASESYVGTCTAKSTIYCSNILAGMAVASVRKHLTGIINDFDVIFNIMTNEFSVTE